MFKNGKTIISEALASFNKIAIQLDAGIQKSKKEAKASATKLDTKRKAFAKVEKELDAKVLSNQVDIDQAENVKSNLNKLLTGKL